MGAGLSIITMDRCVSEVELIKNGWNEYLIPSDSVEDLAAYILKLMKMCHFGCECPKEVLLT